MANVPLFTRELGPEKYRLSPTSSEELFEWVAAQWKLWEKVPSAHAPPNHNAQYLAYVGETLETLRRALGSAEMARKSTGQDLTNALAATESHLNEVFNEFRLPIADSVRGKMFSDLVAEDAFVAKVAMYAFGVGRPIQNQCVVNHPLVARGLVQGVLIQRAEGPTSGTVKKLVDRAEKDLAGWDAAHGKATERIAATQAELEGALAGFQAQSKSAQEQTNKLIVLLKESFVGELEASKKALANFQQVTERDLALKAPTEYWRQKGRGHRRNGYLLFFVMAALMLLFAYAADVFFPRLIVDNPQGKLPSYGHIAVIVVMATLAFWLLRIVARLFFSQTHLAQDAEERVTMVTTYLALSETGKFTANDLQIVLNALFRNAADGIVKDEGMPPSFFEFLTRSK